MIKNLSPSRASQFKTCPKQFKFANVDKLKEPTNEVQAKGTTVHQALEDLFELPKEDRNIENLHNLFREAWTKVRGTDEHHNLFSTVEEEREWGVDGLKLLNNYMTIEDPTSFDPLERERWVRGSIEDLNLRGILDRMDRNEKGELIIVDYKSGKAPMAKYKEPRFFALKLYALLIKEEIGEMPAELKLIYLKNSTIHTLKINEEDLIESKKEKANKDMLHGALWCVGGIIVTAITYSAASGGGTYIVAWGAILFGAIQFLKGLAIKDNL